MKCKAFFIVVFLLFVSFTVLSLDSTGKINYISSALKKHSRVFNIKNEFLNRAYNSQNDLLSPLSVLNISFPRVSKNPAKGDLVVGYSNPDETVELTGDIVVTGNIYILNNGVLTFNNANVTLYGNIVLVNNSSLNLVNSTLTILSMFAYSNSMSGSDNAKIKFENSIVNSNSFNWGVGLGDNASWTVTNTRFFYGTTTSVADNSVVSVSNSNPHEWVISDNGNLSIKDSQGPFILWPVFGNGSVVDTTFPDGQNVSYFEISDSVAGISNVSIKVVIENCSNILWGMMVKKGANVTIRDSVLKTTGIMADTPETWNITGLNNGQYFSDYTVPINGIYLRYVNSSVEVFNVYQIGADQLNIANSIIGEVGVLAGNQSTITKTLIDGSGGYFFTEASSVNTLLLSGLLSHAVSKDNSLIAFINSVINNGDIIARDNSVILLANTPHDKEPKAYEGGIVLDVSLNLPSTVSLNSLIPVLGTAKLYFGEDSEIRFGNYSLSYGYGSEPEQWISILDSSTSQVENGLLGVWNTSGLETGLYTVKITVNLNVGEPIEITKTVFIGAIETETTRIIPHIDNGDYWESYLVLDNLSEKYLTARIFTFKDGGLYSDKQVVVNSYEQKKVDLTGDYGFVSVSPDVSVREIFASKTEGGIAQFTLSSLQGKDLNFLMPAYCSDFLTWEGMAFQNETDLNCDLTMKAYSSDGTVIGNSDINLAPFSKTSGLVGNFFQNIDFQNVSKIAVSSNRYLSGIVISGRQNASLLFTPAVYSANKGTVIIPHIADQWNVWQNYLILDNLGDNQCDVKLVLYSLGAKVLEKNYEILPNGQKVIDINEFKDIVPDFGFVEIGENNVAVREAFKASSGGSAEFLLSSSTSDTLVFNLPLTESSNLNWSGLAIANPGEESASVELYAYFEGEIVASADISIPAHTRSVGLLGDFFPDLSLLFVDRVVVVSDTPLTGLTISGFNQELLLFSNPFFK